MKRILIGFFAGIFLLVVLVLTRALTLTESPRPTPFRTTISVSEADAAQRLSRLIQSRAVGMSSTVADTAGLLRLHALLEVLYPQAHAQLSRERVADLSLLYTWQGSDPVQAPLVLLGHLDTVPADTADAWTWPPFSGTIQDGEVWGRGAIDDRSNVAGILEAVELLTKAGFRPDRTILVAFGHDEETGGWHGAQAIADVLKGRGIKPLMVLDEGGFVTHGAIPGMSRPVAVVGVAEKGSVTFDLVATGQGGHSSIPPASPAAGHLVRAVVALDRNPMPARLEGPAWDLLAVSAPHMSLPLRTVFANRWLFSPVITRVLASQPVTDATIRTTTAVTVLRSGIKENVVPDRAQATVNFRLLPGDSVEDVAEHLARVIDDPAVRITARDGAMLASPVSPSYGPSWDLLSSAIGGAFGDQGVVIAPYLVVGGTDARRYTDLTEYVYRFQPIDIAPSEGTLLHATNERLGVSAFARAVGFYAGLMEAAQASPIQTEPERP